MNNDFTLDSEKTDYDIFLTMKKVKKFAKENKCDKVSVTLDIEKVYLFIRGEYDKEEINWRA